MLNDKDIATRVTTGKAEEARIIESLNSKTYWTWTASTQAEDMHDKVDAWATLGTTRLSAQIKFRQGGDDLGLAMVRPYEGLLQVRQWTQGKHLPWDRDLRTEVDLYVVRCSVGIVIVSAPAMKVAALDLLDELADEPEHTGTVFRSDTEGLELRIVTDKGAGYSYGQQKLICYITPRFMIRHGGRVIQ